LVVEPGMNQRRSDQITLRGAMSGAGAAPAPAAIQFEAAKSAAAQRSHTSMSMADAAVGIGQNASVRRAGNVTFVLRDSVWTDVRYKNSGTVLRVKPFSDAYFRLIEVQPDLREAFSVGEHVIVAGRSMAIELTPERKDPLMDRELALLRDRW